MHFRRLLGVVLLLLGGGLLILGATASHSAPDQAGSAFGEQFTDRVSWFFLGGIASALLGLATLLFRPRHRFLF